MPASTRRRAALLQGAIATLLLAGVMAWAAIAHERPVDQTELRLQLGELRSQAAEAELLASASTRLAPSVFARVHAMQLGHRVEATQGDLDTLQPDPSLVSQTERARKLAARLVAQVHELTGPVSARPVPTAYTGERSILADINALERELDR